MSTANPTFYQLFHGFGSDVELKYTPVKQEYKCKCSIFYISSSYFCGLEIVIYDRKIILSLFKDREWWFRHEI